jgi:predicted MPP superfamily phosphohydrolase
LRGAEVKKILRLIIVLLTAIIGIYVYARYVEPSLLSVHYQNIEDELIKNSHDLKIVQFSDLHLSDYFGVDELKKVADKINAENPDIVVFTGDLFDHYNDYPYKQEVHEIAAALSRIDASKGKYTIYGNHDYGGGAEKAYREVMEESGFTLLVNDKVHIDETNVSIIGLDDSIFGETNVKEVKNLFSIDSFNIVLSHEPDIVERYLEHEIDLFISGHSHGGQVNLPVISSLPALGEKYVRGLYKFENNRNTSLYVNIGIGTSQVPFRFMAVPEITVYKLNSK